MIRRVIQIDEEKVQWLWCLCKKACHEGAIGMVNGKSKSLCVTIIATALRFVFQAAQRTPYPLLSEKLPPMTKKGSGRKQKASLASLFSMAVQAQ